MKNVEVKTIMRGKTSPASKGAIFSPWLQKTADFPIASAVDTARLLARGQIKVRGSKSALK